MTEDVELKEEMDEQQNNGDFAIILLKTTVARDFKACAIFI